MIKWFRSFFKKPENHYLEELPYLLSSYYNPDYQQQLADAIKAENDLHKANLAAIEELHPITKSIIRDLNDTELYNEVSCYSGENKEVRLLKIGRIVENHLQRALFIKKLEDIIDE